MKKFSKTSKDKEMYQDQKEAEKHLRNQSKDFKRYANTLLDFLPIRSGKLLDVGCGFGWVVAEADKRGFQAKGIDEAKPYIALGKQVLRVDLGYTSLEKYSTDEKFDVVTLNHVLEHIKNPKEFLAKIKTLLVPGGLLFVACPNIHSLMYWIFRDRWYGLVPSQHHWQFTSLSLPKIISQSGFKIEKTIVNNLDYQVSGWKGLFFWILLNFAKLTSLGDQAIVIAQKK